MKNTCLSIEDIKTECKIIDTLLCDSMVPGDFHKKGMKGPYHRPLYLLSADNSAESICLYCYFIKMRIPFMLVDSHTSSEKLQEIIHSFQPACLFLPEGKGAFMPSSDYGKGSYYGQYTAWGFVEKSVWEEHRVAPEVAVLLSTSGSTGSGRQVILSYDNIESNADSIGKSLEMREGDRTAVMLPVSYSYGLSVVNSTLWAGGTLLVPEGSLVQKSFWDFLEAERVNILYGVPYTYEILWKLHIWERPFHDLRIITQAGGALSDEMKRNLLEVVKARKERGQTVDFAVMYGQTEATARMSCFFLNRYPEKLHSVGKVIPGGEFCIDHPNELGEGEILYKGKNVSAGYASSWVELTEAVRSQRSAGGRENMCCLYTGDIGWMDPEGFLYLTGRKSRFVKLRGYRMSLDELQRELGSRLECTVICVNGQGIHADQIGVVLQEKECRESGGSGISWERKEFGGMADDRGREEKVERFFSEKRIRKEDYCICRMQEVPRRENGKVDFQKIRERIFDMSEKEGRRKDGISAEPKKRNCAGYAPDGRNYPERCISGQI